MSRRASLSAVLVLLFLASATGAQSPPESLDDAGVETFLWTARIVKKANVSKGITNSLRVTLSDGTRTHDAHVQSVDEAKNQYTTMSGTELNFRDSWRFNVAAYRIDRLLGLNLVPVSIERRWEVKEAAFTWWVDDVAMDEGERLKRKTSAPDSECWNAQMRLIRVFDQLIDNIDRNVGNVLITKNWRVWAIDHTRAFRPSTTPRKPENLTHIDRDTLERLKGLDEATLRAATKNYITAVDVRTLLKRRDAIVAQFEKAAPAAIFDRHASCSF
jgi:hypothetical protein